MLLIWKKGKFVSLATVLPNANRSSLLRTPSFIEDIHPLAVNMIPLSEQAFAAGKFEDTAYFEPFYLKEFQATVAKK